MNVEGTDMLQSGRLGKKTSLEVLGAESVLQASLKDHT